MRVVLSWSTDVFKEPFRACEGDDCRMMGEGGVHFDSGSRCRFGLVSAITHGPAMDFSFQDCGASNAAEFLGRLLGSGGSGNAGDHDFHHREQFAVALAKRANDNLIFRERTCRSAC